MRTTIVKAARKPAGSCGVCGKEIKVGDGYKWVKPRYGGKRVRCTTCPHWRPSELTSSNQLSLIYSAQEAFGDAVGGAESLDEIKELLNTAAEQVREAAEAYREGAQAVEDGFGHATSVSEELEEKADNVEGWADEIDSAGDDCEEFDEDAARQEAESDILSQHTEALGFKDTTFTLEDAGGLDGFDSAQYETDVDDAVEEARTESLEDARGAVGDVVDSSPL